MAGLYRSSSRRSRSRWYLQPAVVQKLASFRRVSLKARKVRDPIFLLGNMPLAEGDVPLGFLQTHRPVHDRDIQVQLVPCGANRERLQLRGLTPPLSEVKQSCRLSALR
jgi:hypothetical protein